MSHHASRTDPQTSHDAAKRAEDSGLVDSDTAVFARLVAWSPGITIPEMGQQLYQGQEAYPTHEFLQGVEHYRQRMGKRAGDARKAGLAHTMGQRDGCACWWPGPEPQAEEQGSLFRVPEKWSGD